MVSISFVSKILALITVIGQLGIIIAVAWFCFFRKQQNALTKFLTKYGILLAFLTALVAMLSSLFYSQIAGFEPCELCWFQRIFMYPLVVVLGLALLKKDSHVVDYAIAMASVGALISLYHNYLYISNGGLSAWCQILGQGVSCMKRYVFEMGYITIPMMALTAFLLIIVLLVFVKINFKTIKF